MNWKLDSNGPRAAVKEAIAKSADVPADFKAAITSQVDAMPADILSVRLTVWSHDVTSKATPGKLWRQVQLTIAAG